MILAVTVIGGVSATLIALVIGTGFGESFLQKWRAMSTLFAAFFLCHPVGAALGKSLSPLRLPHTLKWIAIALGGTALFVVAGSIVGPLFDGNDFADQYDLAQQSYAFIFLLGVAATAAMVVFGQKRTVRE